MPMLKSFAWRCLLLSCFSLLVGCAPVDQPNPAPQAVVLPTPTPEPPPAPPATPTEPPLAAPTEPPATVSTPTTAPADWATTATVEGDYYVLGNPQAPIRLIDFSDFF